MPDDEQRGTLLQDGRFALLSRQIGVHFQQLFGVQKGQLLRQIRILLRFQFREQFLGVLLSVHDHFPDFSDDVLKEFHVPFRRQDHPLPIPLIDVGAVIMIEEVVLAHGAHVGAQTVACVHVELFQRHSLPLRGRLNDLRVHGMDIVVVRDVELDGRARTVAVQHVVHAGLGIDHERHGHHHEVQLSCTDCPQ